MRTLVLLPLLALTGCSLLWPGSGDEDAVACTLEFVMHTVGVRLPDGAPADSVRLFATNRRTGATYGPCDGVYGTEVGCPLYGEPGTYTVYTDAQLAETSRSGDDVTVRGERGDLRFEAAFRFSGGVCHVGKLSGPDTVTLQ